MTDQNLREIQNIIGYHFKNVMLLQQAFIRKSYSQEHREHQHNEVLEFIGDSVLDAAVVRRLVKGFGGYNNNHEFKSRLNEGQMTDAKRKLVNKTMLAHQIDLLGLNQYLIMGKGDIANDVQEDDSVKEDLFEAILGAIALDCEMDQATIDRVLSTLHDIDHYLINGFDIDNDNYVELVQEWFQKFGYGLPKYEYHEVSLLGYYYRNDSNTEYICQVSVPGTYNGGWGRFEAKGKSKARARMSVAQKVYTYLDEHGMLYTMEEEIGEAEEDKAINQLQELAHKGYFPMPEYKFEEMHDRDGNPIWYCECHIAGYEYYYSHKTGSKKVAKKKAALAMLKAILSGENTQAEDDDDWDDDY